MLDGVMDCTDVTLHTAINRVMALMAVSNACLFMPNVVHADHPALYGAARPYKAVQCNASDVIRTYALATRRQRKRHETQAVPTDGSWGEETDDVCM